MTSSGGHGSLTHLDDLAWLVEAQLKEMPGTRLTFSQTSRLCDLTADECGTLLDYLVSAGRLVQDADGLFYVEVENN